MRGDRTGFYGAVESGTAKETKNRNRGSRKNFRRTGTVGYTTGSPPIGKVASLLLVDDAIGAVWGLLANVKLAL